MIHVIGIPMGSDPAPFFANLFLAHKEADWVKTQRKLGTINVRKINNSFWFINDFLSLNDGSTFEKHYKDIYPTGLELKKENDNNSCASFLDLYIYIEYSLNIKNSILDYLKNEITLASISRATSKIEDLTRNCKQLLS